MITLRQLQVLVEVAQSGSFRRCGEKLGLSQVSVSEHVRSLEARLGVALFERRPGAAPVLTEKGRIALLRAEQALAIVSDLVAETSPTATGRTLRLAIHSFLMGDLPPVLDRFRERHPKICLDIDTDVHSPEAAKDLVEQKKADIACFFARSTSLPGTQHIRDEKLSVFVGEKHPFASRTEVSPQELSAEPALRLTERNPLGLLVSEALASVGIEQSRVALQTDEFGLLLHAVRSGLGYACMFEASRDELRDMGLRPVNVSLALPSLNVLLIVRPAVAADRVAAELIRDLTEAWRPAAEPMGNR
ncbi:LysR family transcriptional regulator [Tsuneonella sp. HG222]